jgi:hypothetical protein
MVHSQKDRDVVLVGLPLTSLASAVVEHLLRRPRVKAGNTKGGSITVPLTSCLTGLD